ncbi:MAG: hypothetical protein IJ448_05175 [Oscillospiraceae bacterium]|nr:hypothetical protein [Oscillospiraceae bacterium]
MLDFLLDFISDRLFKLAEDKNRSNKTRVVAGILSVVAMLASVSYCIWDSWKNDHDGQLILYIFILAMLLSVCMALIIYWCLRRRREREGNNKNQV